MKNTSGDHLMIQGDHQGRQRSLKNQPMKGLSLEILSEIFDRKRGLKDSCRRSFQNITPVQISILMQFYIHQNIYT